MSTLKETTTVCKSCRQRIYAPSKGSIVKANYCECLATRITREGLVQTKTGTAKCKICQSSMDSLSPEEVCFYCEKRSLSDLLREELMLNSSLKSVIILEVRKLLKLKVEIKRLKEALKTEKGDF